MKNLLSMIIIISVISLINRPTMADSWNFAVFGDDRSDNTTGSAVNTTAVTAIATDITNNRNASFAIVLGDLVHGKENDTPIATQFNTFKTAATSGGFKVAGEAGAGVPYYPVRGNHDNDVVDPLGVAWKAAFPTLPQNGPTTNTSGGGNSEVGMTYSFTNGNSLFLSLDEYVNTDTYPNQVNQTWVNTQLSSSTAAHVFAYGHLPAYYTVAGESLSIYAAARDAFLTSLYDKNGQIYFAGHQHFSAIASANIDGNASKVFYPIIDGAGGAPGTLWDGTYTDPNVTGLYYNSTSSTPYYYTYSIVTVDDDLVWLRLYGTTSVTTPTWLNLYALVISGTLTTDTNTLISDVANYSTIDFKQASNGTYSKVIIGTGNIVKSGAAELTLSGANTYTGATTVNAGTLKAGVATHAFGVGSAVTVATGGTLDLNGYSQTIGSLAGGGTVINGDTIDTILTTGDTASTTFFGIIQDGTHKLGFTKAGTGTLTLTGANAYTGTTTISAGTLQIGNASALGTGAVTNNATLDVGTTNLAVTGAYKQNAGSTLKLTANSSSSFGKITSGVAATVDAGSTLNVTVGGFIPNNTTLTIIDTGGKGIGSVPTTIISSNSFMTFSIENSGNNLVLTVNRSGSNSFSGVAANSNAATVGAALDNITSPSADMQSVLTALGNLSPSQVASSLNSMTPTVDGAVTQSALSMLSQITGSTVTHLENVSTGGVTGISTGDDYLHGLDIWAQGLGDYAHQDPRGFSNGYNATSWGVSGGADIPLNIGDDLLRMGIGSGYGQTFVRSKDSSGRNDIDSIPGTLYCAYENNKYPLYLDITFTFIYNLYQASRAVTVGTLTERTANADYNGQQYSGYFEGGYSFFYKNLRMTPLVSFQYMHLHTGSYTETGADALNLSVNSQDYDMAMTGFGAKAAYPLEFKYGTIMPDLHAKWLYDWAGDNQAATASFAGGGTAFGTNGFRAARSGYDMGTKISFKTKYNISLDLDYDFLLKADYYEHYGSVTVRYGF
ncbi:MAG: autotransporter domain-containing protein [Candidatus Omnitrophica bacterium]|nr:autotransporter domain-containing protein [Candidatus Omnitrophota bacterium]